MRYRKISTIEAVQFWNDKPWPKGVCECFQPTDERAQGTPHVHTLEGILSVSESDWIATNPAGEKYPIKDSIFRETYEPVTETTGDIVNVEREHPEIFGEPV